MIYSWAWGGAMKTVPNSKAERAAFVLCDAEILDLARMAVTIEDHHGLPMDLEWACDGDTGALFIVQTRPETVLSRADAGAIMPHTVKKAAKPLVKGLGVGSAVATGRVSIIGFTLEIDRFTDGTILATSTTDPDWVPIMKRASAIITDHGAAPATPPSSKRQRDPCPARRTRGHRLLHGRR